MARLKEDESVPAAPRDGRSCPGRLSLPERLAPRSLRGKPARTATARPPTCSKASPMARRRPSGCSNPSPGKAPRNTAPPLHATESAEPDSTTESGPRRRLSD